MPIPADTARVVLSGASPDGEIWETGFWVASSTLTSDAAANTFAADVLALVEGSGGLWVSIAPLCSPDQSLTAVKVYCYPTGGPTATHIGMAEATGLVGTGSQDSPLQVSCCCTILSGIAGRRNRGRMFFPAAGAALTAHYFTNGIVADIATGLSAFLSAVNGISGTQVIVVSQTAGTLTEAASIKVDNRPDIQRRRANKQLATYSLTEVLTGIE